ncbi:phospho-sugar mutase [Specibacter cremeus]|uniref:phospho-sugar mutase n=1 Tax=Specibacter cremeus TaxID=1629051 RepID=UPI000F78E92D|nr:phospho-sugar mutase [Specibacter cremeus]
MTDVHETARQWAANDPDPATAAALRALVGAAQSGHAAAAAELADSFAGPLAFGTAGLRAALGPGPHRMNRVVVRRAAAGVAAHLWALAAADDGGASYVPRAVVGYDARHNSDVFARESAAIFTAAGIETFLLSAALPTPVLAYAVRALGCEAGVMVTASHNPPADNGYKVYLGGRAVEDAARGVQIVAPHDSAIAAHIAAVSDTASAGDVSAIALAADGWTVVGGDLVADYRAAVVRLADRAAHPARDLRIVHTSMHGVGGETAPAILRAAGFTDVAVVPAQADPDPDFPTVAFPNPEEPGALDLALALAAEVGADIVLANDPDADRVAVAACDPATGAWRVLRGDEVGALLGVHLAASARVSAQPGAVFANSIVSSRLLGKVAAARGIAHAQTLTGFKWISRVPGLAFGYEEALGYCVAPELVRDKDGMSAGLLVAELAAELKACGRTLFDVLDDLALAHGLHAGEPLSVRVAGLDVLGTLMSRLRRAGPASLDGAPIARFTDLSAGSDALPPTDGLLYESAHGARVIVRPSGTEPKLKCYLEVVVPVASRAGLPAAKAEAQRQLAAVAADVRAALGGAGDLRAARGRPGQSATSTTPSTTRTR